MGAPQQISIVLKIPEPEVHWVDFQEPGIVPLNVGLLGYLNPFIGKFQLKAFQEMKLSDISM